MSDKFTFRYISNGKKFQLKLKKKKVGKIQKVNLFHDALAYSILAIFFLMSTSLAVCKASLSMANN